jgi:hypothetical protein
LALSHDFIELNRTFREVSLSGGDSDEFDYLSFTFGKGLSWSDLIARHRTVILSEAGSGKTAEIQHAAQRLRAEGKPAFFVRLEHVATGFEGAFEEGTSTEFEAWLQSNEEGWLFLDSVDEARLRSPLDFESAIRTIGQRLALALQRVHIIITSRGTAWRPVTDLRLCEKHLRYVSPAPESSSEGEAGPSRKSDNSPFLIVALEDLAESQIKIFAEARGIADAKPFLQALERADAWSMAARPDDLGELIEFWRTHGRIGNRLELMRSSISRRLAERDQNRAEALPLSAEDAFLGAQTVAAATTMAQESAIRIPDGGINAQGLAIGDIIPGWNEKKQAALLARPVFDEAIYGAVRFHHRTVREYLTAVWFKSLLDRQSSRRSIEAVFFREQYGLEVITPAMRPVLVWLVLLDEKVRERALAVSPELIFEGGEPKALPPEVRRSILKDVCATMDSGVARSTTSDYRAVQRFADHDLAGDVKTLFANYAKNSDVRSFLLRMVWQGQLAEVLPEAKGVALDRKSERYLRIAAFRAVEAVGSAADKLEVREHFLVESARLSRNWLAELIDEAPPTKQSVEWLLACLGKVSPKKPHSADHLSAAIEQFVQTLDLDLVAVLVAGIAGLLVRRPIVERRYCEISERHGWLIKSAEQAAERLIAARHPAALQTPTLSVLYRVPTAQGYQDWDLREIRWQAPELVPAWPELNDALFWYEVAAARRYRDKKKKERLTEVWQVSLFGSYWEFKPNDFERLLAYVNERPLRDDRLVALSAAFRLYVQNGRPRRWREALKAAVAGTPTLRAALHNQLRPAPLSDEQKEWRRRDAGYKRRRAEREAADAKRAQQWKEHLSENIDRLREPRLEDPTGITNGQYYLHKKMREKDSLGGQWSSGNWQALEAEFGPAIAKAFRDGAVAYWRRYKPKLRSEGKAQNTTPLSVIFGLTGLNIEARETPGWASTLDAGEADIAFRYAMDELNGFPDWMPSLFEAFPDLITEGLLREIDWDLKVGTTKHESHYVLADLSWSGKWAWRGIGSGIIARLQACEPKNLGNLGYLLNILQGCAIPAKDIAALAKAKSADRRLIHASRWYAVWAGIDAEQAIAAITERLAKVRGSRQQTNFAMQFVTSLLGSRRSDQGVAGDAFRTPENLKNLYVLMHRYIRGADDIHRAGTGVYSPGLRDDAQDARNNLFSLLKEIPGKESYLALMALTELHPDPSSRPWMLHHAKTKAELDTDLAPWEVQQTLEFQRALERTPTNDRELFELAHMRLLDLKYDIEHGDSSIAAILLKGATQETEMRTYIGNWLRERARDRYAIPQEEELADAKRMDFRFHGNGFDGPVPVELKLADKWSGPELIERLENQLCGDYLRDRRSSHGLFVLVYRGGKVSWQLPGVDRAVDFEGLVEALQEHWRANSDRFLKVDDIRVVGIDLTRRTAGKTVSALCTV